MHGEMMDDGRKDEEYSEMAWAIAARGKSGREIGFLHETWANAQTARGVLDKAQEHLDKALEIWERYDDLSLVARTWCLKGSCSVESNDFMTAADSFKRAQKVAEEVDDVPLVLCAMANRTICEIRRGEAKAAATHARRVFVKAADEANAEAIMVSHCVRAASYQMGGNFSAACNEHEAAAKMISKGTVKSPDPDLLLAMDTNFGICTLRSGRPERAAAMFERALETVRKREGAKSFLTLSRCLFHAGEAKRQAGKLSLARAYLDEAANALSAERAAGESLTIVAAEEADVGSRLRRSKSGALALEIANSCGLCRLEIGTQHLSIPRHGSNERSYLHDEAEHTARSDAYDAKPSENSTGGEDSEGSAAATAAILISEGGQAGEGGVYLAQRINNAVLEGVAWSLAGGGTTDGVAALKRAERLTEKMATNDKTTSAPMSAAMGETGPAGADNDAQLAKLHLGIICNQGVAVRGGVGLGTAFSTGAAGSGSTRRTSAASGVTKDATATLAAVAAARLAARAANAGWREASLLANKHQKAAAQAATDSARQLSVAHAHAGAIEFMIGNPAEAAMLFGRQLDEARKADDALLEAMAERNLADARELTSDLPGALRHLRRCLDLARSARNAAIEADTYRRISGIYALIAGVAAAHGLDEIDGGEAGDATPDEGKEEVGGVGKKDHLEDYGYDGMTEAAIEAKEDEDVAFLRATASRRAHLFAERYEHAASGLAWPIGATMTNRQLVP